MKKVVVIGAESSGKSTLCAQLAAHYGTTWCPEYAREFLTKNGTSYTYDDLLTIAQGQLNLEDGLCNDVKSNLYIIDTDMYVMKVWCEVAFQNCHTWILKQIAERRCDLYLLCDVDLPWQTDELREYPDLEFRKKLFKMYKDIVVNSGAEWSLISGTDNERMKKATAAIDSLL